MNLINSEKDLWQEYNKTSMKHIKDLTKENYIPCFQIGRWEKMYEK